MLALLLATSDEAWLNSTNAILGGVVAVCVVVVAFAAFQTAMDHVRSRARARSHFVFDDHAMSVPELGLTMADGGERVDGQHNRKSK